MTHFANVYSIGKSTRHAAGNDIYMFSGFVKVLFFRKLLKKDLQKGKNRNTRFNSLFWMSASYFVTEIRKFNFSLHFPTRLCLVYLCWVWLLFVYVGGFQDIHQKSYRKLKNKHGTWCLKHPWPFTLKSTSSKTFRNYDAACKLKLPPNWIRRIENRK